MSNKLIYAYIKRGKYKNMIGLVKEGPLDEGVMQYPSDWFDPADEKRLAKDLIDSVVKARSNEVLSYYVKISDASNLISKYMGELGIREFQGGCCG